MPRYYRFGYQGPDYMVNWNGMPRGSHSASVEELGDYLDVGVTAHYHRDMGGLGDTWPVRGSAFTGRQSVRHSGPEQSRLADGQGGGLSGYVATGCCSSCAAGGPCASGGILDLSKSEKQFTMVAAAAVLGFLAWKTWG